ncbi:hypothetical protein KOW79_010019 [Hemibagrus wyckioides]|uniref:BTB domain-containing protein n=1 Tax=Hemibagrus wyckioides TaxID=337641 RepID=A0A9D3NPC3_9TELE|nr:hypothetical protein KOW79_010019 [Hemibagrus wyckioides]
MNYHHYSKEPCDAIIEAGGVYFPVHQQTMLDLSPTFFSDLFSKGPTEFSVYTVHNVAVNIMRSIIQYAYSKQINITRRNMKDLLAVAEYLYVGDIVQLCKQLPEKQHCEEDSCEMTESPTTHFWPDVPPWERSLLYKLEEFEKLTAVHTKGLENVENEEQEQQLEKQKNTPVPKSARRPTRDAVMAESETPKVTTPISRTRRTRLRH